MSAPRLLLGSPAAMRAEPPLSPPDEPTPSPCPRCNGEGYLHPECPSVQEMAQAPECRDCDGTGELWPADDFPEPDDTDGNGARREQ